MELERLFEEVLMESGDGYSYDEIFRRAYDFADDGHGRKEVRNFLRTELHLNGSKIKWIIEDLADLYRRRDGTEWE